MKTSQMLTIIFAILISNLCFSQQETHSATVRPIKEIQIAELKFDQLSQESNIGNLAEYVKDEETSLESFLDAIRIHRRQTVLHPYTEGLAYVNGALCHVGNYSQSIIYTVLEGPHYGLQTTTAYNGIILYINYDYTIEYTPYGVVLHHYYSDSEVITGSNQVIVFY